MKKSFIHNCIARLSKLPGKKLVWVVSISFFVVCPFVRADSDEWKKPVGPIIEEAQKYYASGDLDKTIESYRKVLFVDQFNARVSFALASALEEKGEMKKALKEYSYCMKLIQSDASLSGLEKQNLLKDAEARFAALDAQRKMNDPFAQSELSFFEMNILVMAGVILFFLLYECIAKTGSFITHRRIVREESKIWRDRYWERRKEREIRRLPFPVFPIIMHFLFFIILYKGYSVLKNNGIDACLESFGLAFRSFFS
jgi:tetratricopeptide (TPR) repeat protein